MNKKNKDMNKIELNEKQKAVVKKYLDGDYSPFFASEEEQKAMNEVIDAASKLEDELDAYDESGEDLVKWYFEKYQEQDKEI